MRAEFTSTHKEVRVIGALKVGRAPRSVMPTYLPLGHNRAYELREVVIELDAERLRRLADERGISLASLARAVETTRSALANWLAGTRQLNVEKAAEIAEVLRVRVDDFCCVRAVR